MSAPYAREILQRNVAQICQTVGWNNTHSTPLEILVHLLEKYIITLGIQANRYAEHFNRTEPNLHDLGLVFQDLQVKLTELAEFTHCVPSVQPIIHAKFLKPVESNLNLRVDSNIGVTRPMHLQEHLLRPRIPNFDLNTDTAAVIVVPDDGNSFGKDKPPTKNEGNPEDIEDIFTKPTDHLILSKSKRPQSKLSEEERPREIRSVKMTISGILLSSREGKKPDKNFALSKHTIKRNKKK